jgi:membrane protease YdiL (CAAX protease family)
MAFGGPELPTSALLRFGVVWALIFILTGIFEEFAVRGYPQFTLTRSVGFWPAAIITSLILSVAHAGNSGEAMLGLEIPNSSRLKPQLFPVEPTNSWKSRGCGAQSVTRRLGHGFGVFRSE